MKVKFYMDCGYVGTDNEEIVEFDNDVTEDELDENAQEWFWDNFFGSYGWKYIEEKEEDLI